MQKLWNSRENYTKSLILQPHSKTLFTNESLSIMSDTQFHIYRPFSLNLCNAEESQKKFHSEKKFSLVNSKLYFFENTYFRTRTVVTEFKLLSNYIWLALSQHNKFFPDGYLMKTSDNYRRNKFQRYCTGKFLYWPWLWSSCFSKTFCK